MLYYKVTKVDEYDSYLKLGHFSPPKYTDKKCLYPGRGRSSIQVYTTNYTHMECSGRFPSLDASLITSPEFRPKSAFMRTLTVQMLGHNSNSISRPTTLFITHKISHTHCSVCCSVLLFDQLKHSRSTFATV